MSSYARHSALVLIEDQLDSLGQKYRVQLIVRGGLLWIGLAAAATFAAALTAHLLGGLGGAGGRWIAVDLTLYLGLLIASFAWWIGKPLLLRPSPLHVAELVEKRVAGLHNGLSNSLLLSRRQDIAASPYLPAIYDEILGNTRAKPLDSAVRWSDLRPLALRVAGVLLPLALLCYCPPVSRMLRHGWAQVFNPTRFVPTIGLVSHLEVQPGDITLVGGQPLEVTILAAGADAASPPTARLIFDALLPEAQLIGSPLGSSAGADAGTLRYSYRVDHVDQPLRYRAEVAGTQSPWFTVTVVRQVKLEELTLDITPPLYAQAVQPRRQIQLKPDQIDQTPLSAPQGSKLELAVQVDVPVDRGMLAVNDAPPAAMDAIGKRHFVGTTLLTSDVDLSVLLTEGAGQIIATVPEHKLSVRCVKDQPPTIEMKWPMQDALVALDAPLKIRAFLKDDYGLTSCQVLWAAGSDAPLGNAIVANFPPGTLEKDFECLLPIPAELRKHRQTLRLQLIATDNRDLRGLIPAPTTNDQPSADSGVTPHVHAGLRDQSSADSGGPQSVSSQVYKIEFRDAAQMAAELKEQTDALRAALLEMLKLQHALLDQSAQVKAAARNVPLISRIGAGQSDLRTRMDKTARTFAFDDATRIIQKTLALLWAGQAKEAVELAAALKVEAVDKEAVRELADLQTRQRRIAAALESLLSLLNAAVEPATQPTLAESGHIPSRKEELQKLDDALKQFMKEEQRILDQTASLAKKPVDNYNDQDKKLLEELKLAQEKLDAFMEQKLSDFSKNAEQDLSNPALIKDLMSIYAEVTMAKDALNKQSAEIAVADEELGLEGAKELASNIEKWLPNAPDRAQWTQEDPVAKTDTPMPELPKELEDMIGELMEQQEDIAQEAEDSNANWTDSMDKGVGWDATDGPIADMSGKGVTGNTLPNDNEMGGRSGEGRSGKSQGEMIGDTATGKGGRNTPTRVDPTPFEKGQVKDTSKDPVGGATGGGKLSGQGGQGLEGPLAPKTNEQMQRLAQKEAQLRNTAENLQLKYHLNRYDNYKLQDSVALMRRLESDLQANRYQSAMRTRDVLLDRLDTSKLLIEGRVSVDHDTSASPNSRLHNDISDAMKGELPAAWSDALKEYYKQLSQE